LTILGKTQHISFPVRTRLERPNEVAVTGTTKLNRNDYGMSFDRLRAARGLTTVTFHCTWRGNESREYVSA
jgi:polyisoprenoid-binding protein YceI